MNLNLPKNFESYKPKVSFCIEEGDFLIKTAETKAELAGAFYLRNSVFYKEWTGKSAKNDMDIDKYDMWADHLIIIDKKKEGQKDQVIGTYRLIPSSFLEAQSLSQKPLSQHFYTEDFFHIDSFLNKKIGNKIEMGRACVHKTFRGSKIIHYIWLGLGRYFRLSHSRYMFGSVSIIKITKLNIANVYQTLLSQNKVSKDISISPKDKYKIKSFNSLLLKANNQSLLKIPRLFTWYLNMGGQIHGPPGYDPQFSSYDFFMSLDFKHIKNPKLVNRYADAVYLRDNLPD